MQWYGTILPRIKAHVPTQSILEIACGFGRWTQYLKDVCKHLTVVDLSKECIQGCQERFLTSTHIEYHVNDGKSLGMVRDRSVDFVFSFDSLVHADDSVIEAYLSQLPRILNEEGVAFIHHSNLGEYHARYSRIRRIPGLEALLSRAGVLDSPLHWRSWSVDSQKVEALAERYGLRCISQEIVLWGTKRTFIDCLSTLTKRDSLTNVANKKLRNANFMREADHLLQLSRLYGPNKKQEGG